MQVFETARLRVRRLQPLDLEEFHAVCSDPEVVRFMGDGQPVSRESTQKWIERSLRNYETLGYGTFAVIEKGSERFIGWCGLVHTDQTPDVEIVYAFAKDCWGKGYASELVPALMEYGFRTLKLSRIVATIAPENQASIHVVTKLGMRYDETRPDEHGLPTAFFSIDAGQAPPREP